MASEKTMKTINIDVDEGIVLVNQVWVETHLENAILILGDLRSKYAQLDSIITGENEIEILLESDSETLNLGKDTDEKTCITITAASIEDWHVFVEVSRYSFRLALMKSAGNKSNCWVSSRINTDERLKNLTDKGYDVGLSPDGKVVSWFDGGPWVVKNEDNNERDEVSLSGCGTLTASQIKWVQEKERKEY